MKLNNLVILKKIILKAINIDAMLNITSLRMEDVSNSNILLYSKP